MQNFIGNGGHVLAGQKHAEYFDEIFYKKDLKTDYK